MSKQDRTEVICAELAQLAGCNTGRHDDKAVFSADLAGYAAQAATKVLLENWQRAMTEGSRDNLIHDIDDLMRALTAFKVRAQAILPVEQGGLEGKPADEWEAKLLERGVSVYESDDAPGLYGFTGCESDWCTSMDDAIVAAVAQYLRPEEQDESAKMGRHARI